MLRWQTQKRWMYHGRNCEIQRTSIDDATQYRGLVELETDVPDRALDSFPTEDVYRTRRPMRRGRDEYRTWLFFSWSGDGTRRLRDAVNDLAQYADETEI